MGSEMCIRDRLNSTLFSPFWQSNIQGQISNLNFSTGRTELYAATLESFCFRIKQCLDVMNLNETSEIIIDGGVSQNNYLAHYQANLLEKDLKRVSGLDGTMRGVFLGCLAYLNRKTFSITTQKALKGKLIKSTQDVVVKNLLNIKYKRFNDTVMKMIQKENLK